jgi:hypothetical protein
MSDEKFDLIFRGEIVAGFNLDQVKQNMQALFRLDATKIDGLFAGKPVPLKKGLDSETANKYRVAMKKAGAQVALVISRVEASAGQVNSVPGVNSALPTQAPNPQFSTSLGAQDVRDHNRVPSPPIHAPEFGVAAVGSDLLKPNERAVLEAVNVDISHLNILAQDGNLLRDEEIAHPQINVVQVPTYGVAEVGSDLLRDEEKPVPVAGMLDVPDFGIAAVGERLSIPAPVAPSAPNVDHIRLAPQA